MAGARTRRGRRRAGRSTSAAEEERPTGGDAEATKTKKSSDMSARAPSSADVGALGRTCVLP